MVCSGIRNDDLFDISVLSHRPRKHPKSGRAPPRKGTCHSGLYVCILTLDLPPVDTTNGVVFNFVYFEKVKFYFIFIATNA